MLGWGEVLEGTARVLQAAANRRDQPDIYTVPKQRVDSMLVNKSLMRSYLECVASEMLYETKKDSEGELREKVTHAIKQCNETTSAVREAYRRW